jgi:hypothetical protein
MKHCGLGLLSIGLALLFWVLGTGDSLEESFRQFFLTTNDGREVWLVAFAAAALSTGSTMALLGRAHPASDSGSEQGGDSAGDFASVRAQVESARAKV